MNFNVFEDNPALPKKREKMMLTNLITHYDDLKNEHLENMVEQIELGKVDFLENEANQTILSKIAYYLNLANPKEWLFLTTFSIVTTFFLILIDNIMIMIVGWRYNLIDGELTIQGVLCYICSGLLFALTATSMGYFVSPDSDGSGIPEIKVVLSGVPMYNFYNFNSLIGKTIGIIAGLGAGLTIGKAGPYVHIACTISKQLLKINYFESIKNSSTGKHTMLTVGASAAVVLTFGTPIAAVIFAIEQTGTIFLVANLWKSFYVAMICIYSRNLVERTTSLKIYNLKDDLIGQTHEIKANEIYFIFLAIILGVLASFLNIILGKVAYSRRHSKNKYYNNRFWYISIVAIVCSFFAITIPPLRAGIAKTYSILWSTNSDGKALLTKTVGSVVNNVTNNTNPIDFHNLFNTSSSESSFFSESPIHGFLNNSTIKNFSEQNNNLSNVRINRDPLLDFIHPNEAWILILCIFARSITLIISNASNSPLGVIGPALLIGSMVGRLYGHIVDYFAGTGQEHIFSMIGGSCMLSGTIHSITPPIIIFETTGNTNYLVHLLFASLISYMIAQSLSLNAFDLILYIRNLPYLPSVKSSKLYKLNAKEIKENISYYLREGNHKQDQNLSYYLPQSSLQVDPESGELLRDNFLKNKTGAIKVNNNANNNTTKNNFDRCSLLIFNNENEVKVFDELNIISALILLYKIPKHYNINIPIVDSNDYIKYTITPKKLFLYVNNEYNINKSKLDIRIQSSLKELLNFFKMKFFPPESYFIYKIFLKIKKFFENINESHKHKLDKYFVESSMFEIIRSLKKYASINKESFLNNPINEKNNILDLDSSYLTIEQTYSALKIQFLFTFLSMSHLFVTEKGKLIGIITKEDFIKKSMTIK